MTLTLDFKAIIAALILVVGWTTGAVGLYYGISRQIERQADSLSTQVKAADDIKQQIQITQSNQKSLERSVIELTVQLRTLEIIK